MDKIFFREKKSVAGYGYIDWDKKGSCIVNNSITSLQVSTANLKRNFRHSCAILICGCRTASYYSRLCARAVGHFVMCKEFLQIFEPFSKQWTDLRSSISSSLKIIHLLLPFPGKKTATSSALEALENQFTRIILSLPKNCGLNAVGE